MDKVKLCFGFWSDALRWLREPLKNALNRLCLFNLFFFNNQLSMIVDVIKIRRADFIGADYERPVLIFGN
jgi:hypothetical protein